MFARYEDVKRKRCENEKWPQDKGDVKIEGVKGINFNRKRSQNKSGKQQDRKMVPSKNRVKRERERCGEKRMSREAGLKKKICPMKHKDKDAKRKSCQRKAAETTSVSRDSDDIRKSLSGEKSVSSLWFQGCRQEGLSRLKNDKHKPDQESGSIREREFRNVKGQDFQEKTQSTAVPARRSGAVPIGSPLSL